MHKLFVFDVDGTFLTSDHLILPSTREALDWLKGKGCEVMLASARPPMGLTPIISDLRLPPLYIALNGALVVNQGEIAVDKPMDRQAYLALLELARQTNGLSVNVFSGNEWYVWETDKWSAHEGDIINAVPKVTKLQELSSVHKVLVMGEPSLINRFQDHLRMMNNQVSATISKPSYCEIVADGVSKAATLGIISKQLGYALDDVVAFGDGENDASMLELAGTGVAMGNSSPSLHSVADYVSESNDRNGIFQGVKWALTRIAGN